MKKSLPKEWPADADKIEQERAKFVDTVDFPSIKKSDPQNFACSFIAAQPIRLKFEGLDSKKRDTKFAIIGSNTTLTTFNYYVQKIGKHERLTTFSEDELLEHVYVTLTGRMDPEARAGILKKYEQYKSNPRKAILCCLSYKGEERLIPLSDLITDDLLNNLAKKPPSRDAVIALRDSLATKTAEQAQDEDEDDEMPDDDRAPVPEKKAPSKPDKEELPSSSDKKRKASAADLSENGRSPKKPASRKKDDRVTISVDSADPALAGELSNTVLTALATMFNYPVEHSALVGRLVFEIADILRKRKEDA